MKYLVAAESGAGIPHKRLKHAARSEQVELTSKKPRLVALRLIR